jgi:hypothetical protein
MNFRAYEVFYIPYAWPEFVHDSCRDRYPAREVLGQGRAAGVTQYCRKMRSRECPNLCPISRKCATRSNPRGSWNRNEAKFFASTPPTVTCACIGRDLVQADIHLGLGGFGSCLPAACAGRDQLLHKLRPTAAGPHQAYSGDRYLSFSVSR